MPLFDKLKNKFEDYSKKAQQQYFPGQQSSHHQQPIQNAPPPPPPQQSGTRMKWPPKLMRTDVLGEIRDVNGRTINRDGGRSVQFNNRLYYMFGDTFCFDDSNDFKGVANNSIALIPDPSDATKSQYWERQPLVSNFVPHTHDEARETEKGKEKNIRIVNWVFGGIVENDGGGEGYLWYDKIRTEGAMATQCFGMGVAKVKARHDGTLECERVKGEHMVFGEHEPRFFSITAWKDPDGWIYGFGSLGNELGNKLARVRKDADFSDRKNYQFFKKGGEWVDDYNDPGELEDVIAGMSQGGIVYMPDNGPPGKPYVWFGVNKFMSSEFYCGASEKIEGPYDIHELGHGPKIMENSNHLYCLYPHAWASDFSNGMVTLSWSDDGILGGKVAAGRFIFELE